MIEQPSEIIDRRRTVRGPGADYMLYEGKEALCEGVTRSSKSWSLMFKMDYVARTYPFSRQLVARETRESLNESILKDWREEILWPGHPAISPTASRDFQDRYTYPNKSEIVFAGLNRMNDTSSPILSTKWDRIYIIQAEETKEAAWETLATRLSSFKTPYHQLTADCNPAAPSHWLNRRFGPSKVGKNRKRFLFRLWDNPYFYTGTYPDGTWTREGSEYKETQEAVLEPGTVRYKRYYQGLWVAADNMILDNYDPDRHILSASELENDPQFGWLLHSPRFGDQPIRINYFTAGVDWGWEPDPGVISVWGYDAPRWHPKIRRFRVVEVAKQNWFRDQWAELAIDLWQKYQIRWFSCDRSNPEARQYFNLRLTKAMGRDALPIAVKCPPLGGGHRQDKDKATQIDLMREGLGMPNGHQRTYLLDSAFILGHDENLRRLGLPTCYEQEVESWCFEQKPGEALHEGTVARGSRDDCLDAARYDETLNFARGFGDRSLESFQRRTLKGTNEEIWQEHLEEKQKQRRKKRRGA